MLFQTQNSKDVRNTSETTKIQDLGKQRERSLCSLKIKISTNLPTNRIPSKILTQNVFQTQNLKDVRNASRTIKIRDLGKQRERSLCSRKTKISTNYPASLVLTKFFLELKIQKVYTTRPGFSHSIHNNIQNCIPSYSSSLQVKTNFQTVNHIQKQKAT